jgi:hypothetical protein
MHGTLKHETADPPDFGERSRVAATLRGQRRRFDAFVREYNEHRPHEALGMATPSSVYEPSRRAYPERLVELEYPADCELRKVDAGGNIRWRVAKVFLSRALDGQVVGPRELDADGRVWAVTFGPLDLGLLDARRGRLLRPAERTRLGL